MKNNLEVLKILYRLTNDSFFDDNYDETKLIDLLAKYADEIDTLYSSEELTNKPFNPPLDIPPYPMQPSYPINPYPNFPNTNPNTYRPYEVWCGTPNSDTFNFNMHGGTTNGDGMATTTSSNKNEPLK